MKYQRLLNVVCTILILITLSLLYAKITGYYQLYNMWVEHTDDRLRNYILVLWILAIALILSSLCLLHLHNKDLSYKTWLAFGILLITFSGSVFQVTQTPNFQSYHITPYAISATTVEKHVNKKKYNINNDSPIYFYRKSDATHKKVMLQIRHYSLKARNDLPCIDLATLRKSIGKRRYEIVLKNANIKSNNALFIKYYDEKANDNRITFNNLQDPFKLKNALNFIEKNV